MGDVAAVLGWVEYRERSTGMAEARDGAQVSIVPKQRHTSTARSTADVDNRYSIPHVVLLRVPCRFRPSLGK